MRRTTAALPLRRVGRREAPGPVSNPPWVDEVIAVYVHVPDDTARLHLAIDLARENVVCATGGPFGAVIVDERSGDLVSVGVEGVERVTSSLAHAEIVALATAEARLGRSSFADGPVTLYASCEPCAMCLGAIAWSGVRRIVYAAHHEDAAAVGFDEGPVVADAAAALRRRGIVLEPGPLRAEAADVLRLALERGSAVYDAS